MGAWNELAKFRTRILGAVTDQFPNSSGGTTGTGTSSAFAGTTDAGSNRVKNGVLRSAYCGVGAASGSASLTITDHDGNSLLRLDAQATGGTVGGTINYKLKNGLRFTTTGADCEASIYFDVDG